MKVWWQPSLEILRRDSFWRNSKIKIILLKNSFEANLFFCSLSSLAVHPSHLSLTLYLSHLIPVMHRTGY